MNKYDQAIAEIQAVKEERMKDMEKKYTIQIQKISKSHGGHSTLKLDCTIVSNDFDEHDTAGILFALEFAANNHSEIPIRVHITELN